MCYTISMEIEIIKSLQLVGNETLDFFCKFFSYLFSFYGFIACLAIFFFFVNKKFAINFSICYLISVCFNYLLKAIIARPRPYVVDSQIINKLSAVGNSFPSGHTLSGTIICAYLIFLIFKHVKNKLLKSFLIASLILCLAFLIFSRMYLGQHYLSDTIAGLVLGVFASFIGLFIYIKKNNSWQKTTFIIYSK